MKCLIIGDVHGAWGSADDLIQQVLRSHRDIEVIIQVGDMGFGFPKTSLWDTQYSQKCIWIDGNHDNHELLRLPKDNLSPEQQAFLDQWEYMPRGSFWNGILFMGGARSIDKHRRTRGVDWWDREDISALDMNTAIQTIEDVGPENIHTVISHDAPTSFSLREGLQAFNGPRSKEFKCNNRDILDHILRTAEPERWFFGHYHFPWSSVTPLSTSQWISHTHGCHWRCIDMIRGIPAEDYVILDL